MSNNMKLSPKMISTLIEMVDNGGGVEMIEDANIDRALRRRGLVTDIWQNRLIEGRFRFELTEEGWIAAAANRIA